MLAERTASPELSYLRFDAPEPLRRIGLTHRVAAHRSAMDRPAGGGRDQRGPRAHGGSAEGDPFVNSHSLSARKRATGERPPSQPTKEASASSSRCVDRNDGVEAARLEDDPGPDPEASTAQTACRDSKGSWRSRARYGGPRCPGTRAFRSPRSRRGRRPRPRIRLPLETRRRWNRRCAPSTPTDSTPSFRSVVTSTASCLTTKAPGAGFRPDAARSGARPASGSNEPPQALAGACPPVAQSRSSTVCTTGSAVWAAICTMHPILPAATNAAPVLSIATALRAPSAPAKSG